MSQLLLLAKIDVNQWKDVLLGFAQRVAESLVVDVRNGDTLDLESYFKIKVCDGGAIRDCAYVDGVVFTKNVAHRKMWTDIRNPRILLLRCALEWQRVGNKMSSFDTLLEQEDQHIRLQVNKLVALKVAVFFIKSLVFSVVHCNSSQP